MSRLLKRGLHVLALFDLGEPITFEQDLAEDLKSEAWKTEADPSICHRSVVAELLGQAE